MVFIQYACQQATGLGEAILFAVTSCVLNQRFIDQELVGPEEAI